jgi:hypothetical protein
MAAPIPSGRSEGRTPQILAAEVSLSEESVPKETAVTENVSLHGARVTTVRPWQSGPVCWLLFYGMAFCLKERSLSATARGAAAASLLGVELSGRVQAA